MSDDSKKDPSEDRPKRRSDAGFRLTPPPKAEMPAAIARHMEGAEDVKSAAQKAVGAAVAAAVDAAKSRSGEMDAVDASGEPVAKPAEPTSSAERAPTTPTPSSPDLPRLGSGGAVPVVPAARTTSGRHPPLSTPPPLAPAELTPKPRRYSPAVEGAVHDEKLRIGDYTVDNEIGAGGMSVVYRSHQDSLGRPVAIKVLRQEIAVQPRLVQRFEREAKSLAALQHENILHIYEYRADGEVPYMVTEYVEGVDLYDVLERHERLPVDVAAVVAAQVARALDYAHSRGVIHRDVKPANIMFTVQGGIKLMDFGIARRRDSQDLTQAGAGVGTPAYMSPEQILAEKLDGRTDIWSLGVVLYQMVTGRKPFLEDPDRSVLHKIRADKPVPPRQVQSGIPRPLERIIVRCLEKRAADRYPVAQQLALALERFVAARVAMGHQAQLLYYLRSVDEFTEEQVQAALPEDPDSGYRATFPRPPRRHSDRPPLGVPWAVWVGSISGVLMMTFLIVVLATWPSKPPPSKCPTPPVAPSTGYVPAALGPQPDAPKYTGNHGGLRVVVHPWAEVVLGGKVVETTPFDRPLSLPVGVHEVVLRHPKLGRVQRKVQVHAGQVFTLRVDLLDKKGGGK